MWKIGARFVNMSIMTLSPQNFFDFSDFVHKTLFEKREFVWEALLSLKAYIDELVARPRKPFFQEGVFLENPEKIVIGQGTKIEAGAYIRGPCWIGEESIIRHGAYVRDYVLTGKGCVIGHATEIKHSILLDGVHAAHFNYVGDSILGNYVNLGAGAKCANLRLDQRAIVVHWEKQKIETDLRKFGAILGDYAQLGCNTVTNPGTLLFPKVICAPCLNVGGVVTSSIISKLNSATPSDGAMNCYDHFDRSSCR
jgi:UDP-N-acetylglucosamine diphosphorylase / glucose-1-phosphate thymidylyltransferase / UDP-N-acetylgalactosamine diphosphorylase / glucosamine-1-phosphate N-acetyltransferase / galactosamine-1-phosphate N-acetyltransferase